MIMMAKARLALVGKVGIRVRGRAEGLVEGVAFAGGGVCPQSADGALEKTAAKLAPDFWAGGGGVL